MERLIQIVLTGGLVALIVYGIWMEHREHGHVGHGHKHKTGHKHDGAVFSIDYYAYASGIRGWNPYFKAVFALICLILCIAFNNIYVSLTVIIVMGFITIVPGRLAFSRYVSLMTIPIVFMIFGSIAIAVGFSFSPIGQYHLHLGFFYIYTSTEQLLKMAALILKAFGAVSAMYMLTLSTPANEIIRVLRSAKVPKLIVELMNMIYRYIFILMDTQCRMKNAAASRLGYVDFKTSCLSFGRVASNLLIVSLKKGNAYYQALEARCYDGELIFLEDEKKLTAGQVVPAVLFTVLLIFIWAATR